jgi:hypothetical protein
LDAEGSIGGMFETLGAISPAPPEGSQSPLLWGTEGHVRELLGDAVEFERHAVEFEEPSPGSCADFMLTSFPPLIAAQAQLGPWDEVRVPHSAFVAHVK